MGAICDAEALGVFVVEVSFVLLFDGSSDFFPNLKKSRFRGFPPLSPPTCSASVSSDLSREDVVPDVGGAVASRNSASVPCGPLMLSICCDMAAVQARTVPASATLRCAQGLFSSLATLRVLRGGKFGKTFKAMKEECDERSTLSGFANQMISTL